MASSYIETSSLSADTTPSNAGTLIRNAQWGIDAALSGYIIQSASVNHTRTYDTTQDQKGATVSELDYDETWDLTLTVVGGDGNEQGVIPGISVGDINFTWDNLKWKVRSVQFNGAYNAKKSYTITAVRFAKFPVNG